MSSVLSRKFFDEVRNVSAFLFDSSDARVGTQLGKAPRHISPGQRPGFLWLKKAPEGAQGIFIRSFHCQQVNAMNDGMGF